MTPEESSRSEQKRRRDEEREARRQAEIELGRAAVKKYELFEKVNKGVDDLRKAFPGLVIGTVINNPYTHVTIRAENKVDLAPLDNMAVLESSLDELKQIELEDPIEGFPSDHLVAQLALIA